MATIPLGGCSDGPGGGASGDPGWPAAGSTADPGAHDAGGSSPALDAGLVDAPSGPKVDGQAAPSDAGGEATAPSGHSHARCGWIGADDTAGYAAFAANAAFFDVVHPDWYMLDTSDLVSVKAITGEGDATVLAAAAANHVRVWPMIAGVDYDPNGVPYVRQMLADPAKVAAHVKNLVDLAVSKGYPGLDIDYEHLWEASDRAPYEAFITQLSQAMHAAGKELSIALPPLSEDADGSAWKFADLVGPIDVLHIMGYDFHTIGTHAGPLAPLGWIDAVSAHAASTGHPEKFRLGLGNYGTTPTSYCDTQHCIARCGGTYATTTDHMLTCSYGSWDAGRAPNCATGGEQLFFEDTGSMEEKLQTARAHGLGGMTYWTIGGEPDGFFAMAAKYY